MKTYQELMEVMSMKDMNKIAGGTEAQRKIAQDRQKKREAKAKGFDPNKEVLANRPKQEEEPKKEKLDPNKEALKNKPKVDRVKSLNVDVNKLPTVDQAAKERGVEKPTALTKATASKDRASNAAKELESRKPSTSSAIVKAPERRPDIRKSQIGKWSEGIKKSPGKLAKRPESKPARQEVEKVKVKVDEPKKRNDMEGQAAQRPGTTKPEKEVGQGVVDNMKKKRKKRKGLGLGSKAKGLARRAYGVAKGVDLGRTGIATSGDLEGLSGKQSYE